MDGDPIDGHQIPITATTARHGKLQRNLIGKPSKGRVHNGVAHDGVSDPNDIVDVGRGGRAPLPTGMGRGVSKEFYPGAPLGYPVYLYN